MKKLASLFLPLLLVAQIDTNLIQIEAKLFPKILFLDKDLEKKLINNKIVIHILTQPKYQKTAELFHKLLHHKTIFNKEILVKIYIKNPPVKPTAYIIVAESEYIQKHFSNLVKNRIIFSALPKTIAYGMVSIAIDHKVYPLINPKNIKAAHITFYPILFKVAKFYE